MQILNDRQVSYCNVVIKKKYLLGMSFQNKIYIKNKLYSSTDKHDAIEYCRQKYLEARGSKSYILVENITGLTVWVENKSAKILGQEDPAEIIKNIDIEDLVAKMRSVGGIEIEDRQHNMNVYKECVVGNEVCEYLINSLEVSIKQAIALGQRLMDEKWIYHVVDRQPFQNEHLFYRFYWDENRLGIEE